MMKLRGKWQRARPKRRFVDVEREDMQITGLTEGDAEDTVMEDDETLW